MNTLILVFILLNYFSSVVIIDNSKLLIAVGLR